MTDPKTFLTKLRLYLATVFARSMPKMIMGVPGLNDNQALFSNISLIEAELYSPDAEYYIHRVTFTDEEFVSDLFEQFPLLKNAIVLLYTDKFFSQLNKHEGTLAELSLESNGTDIVVNTIQNKVKVSSVCGVIISEYQASRYADIFNDALFQFNGADCIPIPLKDKINQEDKVTVIKIDNSPALKNVFACALLNNQSTVAVSEFVKKANITSYVHQCWVAPVGDVIKINVWFSCDCIEVLSTQPAVVWFPKSDNKNKEVNND